VDTTITTPPVPAQAPEPVTLPQTVVTIATKHKVVIGMLAVLVIIFGLLGSFFGYSYKKEEKVNITLSTENDTLRKQLSSHTDSTTTSEPVEVGGKIVYRTVIRYIHDSSEVIDSTHSSAVSNVKKTTITTEKDFAMFAVGKNLHLDWCASVQRDVLNTPIGHFGIMISPNFSSFKYSAAYLTWKP